MNNRRQMLTENRDKVFDYLAKCELPKPKSVVNPKRVDNPVTYGKPCGINIIDADTISAAWEIHRDPGAKIVILNFASFRHPGGGFMTGAMAQEESICHHTNLYHALAAQEKWYAENERLTNRSLYQNRSILTSDVSIIARGIGNFVRREEVFRADFLTCACPNAGAARSKGVSEQEINRAIEDRASYIVELLAGRSEYSHVILGAFGCGAFRCDPRIVANAFRKCIEKSANSFDTVVFAIPDGKNGNLAVFRQVFGK